MAKPLDNMIEHSSSDGAGGPLPVTSHGKLPTVCEDQMERLFRCGSDLLEAQSTLGANQRILLHAQ